MIKYDYDILGIITVAKNYDNTGIIILTHYNYTIINKDY